MTDCAIPAACAASCCLKNPARRRAIRKGFGFGSLCFVTAINLALYVEVVKPYFDVNRKFILELRNLLVNMTLKLVSFYRYSVI